MNSLAIDVDCVSGTQIQDWRSALGILSAHFLCTSEDELGAADQRGLRTVLTSKAKVAL